MIFTGENEHDVVKEKYTFKIIGGEELPDEEQEWIDFKYTLNRSK